jgi:hypothetical protein
MANKKSTENLIPLNQKTEEDKKKIQSMGGKATAAKKRKAQTIRAYMKELLALKPDCKTLPDSLKQGAAMLGIALDFSDIETNDILLSIALFLNALTDITHRKYLDEILGRNPSLELKKAELKLKRDEFKIKQTLANMDAVKLEIYRQHMSGRLDLDTLFSADESELTDNGPQ